MEIKDYLLQCYFILINNNHVNPTNPIYTLNEKHILRKILIHRPAIMSHIKANIT